MPHNGGITDMIRERPNVAGFLDALNEGDRGRTSIPGEKYWSDAIGTSSVHYTSRRCAITSGTLGTSLETNKSLDVHFSTIWTLPTFPGAYL